VARSPFAFYFEEVHSESSIQSESEVHSESESSVILHLRSTQLPDDGKPFEGRLLIGRSPAWGADNGKPFEGRFLIGRRLNIYFENLRSDSAKYIL
jgi:hypothetical protein